MMKRLIIYQFIFIALVSQGGTATIEVSAFANIFGAGHATPPNPGGGSGGILPPSYSFAPGSGQMLSFSSVTGQWTLTVGSALSGADGYFNVASTDINPCEGISGIQHDGACFLVGVFLGSDEPTNPAPPSLDFRASGLGTSFVQLSPTLGQTFYIGDGLTGTGSGIVQQFNVPTNATRLFLGVADAYSYHGDPGYYGDNGGAVTASFQIITTTPPSLGISSMGQLVIWAPVGSTNRIEYTSDLWMANWQTLTNLVIEQTPSNYTDPEFGQAPQRFYRAVLLQ
jgi:hypothetical protein